MVGDTTTMPEWLAHRARLSPERLAVISDGESLTFAQLDQRVSRMAAALRARGVGPGHTVAVLCRNGTSFVELAHAIPRLGSTFVPVNGRLTTGEIHRQLVDAGSHVLVHDAVLEKEAIRVEESHGGLARINVTDVGDGSDHPPIAGAEIDLSTVHSIIYTSGTTGEPKGALLSHGNFWHSAVGSALNLGHLPQDRWLAVLPLFHVGGLSILLRSVICGITAVIHERFDAANVNRAIDEHGITIVSVVSTMVKDMLDRRADRPYPPSLRCVLLGGGPAPRPLLERCAVAGIPVVQTYGLTEAASQVTTLPPSEALQRLGSAGKPLMTAEVRIEERGELLGPGEAGEILVRGPIVTSGYLGRPEETDRALRGGWLHTGDIGYLDPQGYLYVLDRRTDLIVSGGENIYPAEVEAVLMAHPAVADAAIFGVADERWGQTVMGALVRQPGTIASDEEILTFCRARLGSYKVPRRLTWLEWLPRNAGGKLLRRELQRLSIEAATPAPGGIHIAPTSLAE